MNVHIQYDTERGLNISDPTKNCIATPTATSLYSLNSLDPQLLDPQPGPPASRPPIEEFSRPQLLESQPLDPQPLGSQLLDSQPVSADSRTPDNDLKSLETQLPE